MFCNSGILGIPLTCVLVLQQRGEVVTSRCHGSKSLDDNKRKIHLKIRTVSNFIDPIQFYLICQMLAKFSRLNSKEPYLSLEKEKRNFLCFVHLLRKAGA